jgi:hypothetical protein
VRDERVVDLFLVDFELQSFSANKAGETGELGHWLSAPINNPFCGSSS